MHVSFPYNQPKWMPKWKTNTTRVRSKLVGTKRKENRYATSIYRKGISIYPSVSVTPPMPSPRVTPETG